VRGRFGKSLTLTVRSFTCTWFWPGPPAFWSRSPGQSSGAVGALRSAVDRDGSYWGYPLRLVQGRSTSQDSRARDRL